MNSAATPAQLSALASAARQLPEPQGYYQGHDAPTLLLPHNVLAFHRDWTLLGASCHSRHVLMVNVDIPSLMAIDGVVLDTPPATAAVVFPYQHHHYPQSEHQPPCRLFFTFDLPDSAQLSTLRNRVIALPDHAIRSAIRACHIYQLPAAPKSVQSGQSNSATDSANELVLLVALIMQAMLTQAASINTKIASKEKSTGQATNAGSSAKPSTNATNAASTVTFESRQLVLAVGRYLKQHLSDPISIPDLADALALSPSHLRYLFKLELKMSLGQYIRRSKCINAASLIDTTPQSFSQISSACGYSTHSAFSRSFTREMGMSPRQYRTRQR